jgi:hypothetical protein
MASSHLYEGYRSNVSANRSGKCSNFTGATAAIKKLSKPSSPPRNANGHVFCQACHLRGFCNTRRTAEPFAASGDNFQASGAAATLLKN